MRSVEKSKHTFKVALTNHTFMTEQFYLSAPAGRETEDEYRNRKRFFYSTSIKHIFMLRNCRQ